MNKAFFPLRPETQPRIYACKDSNEALLPQTVCTETSLAAAAPEHQARAEHPFAFLISDIASLQAFSKPWTDEKRYAKYGLTEEIAFIESMIRPMDEEGDREDA